MSCVGGRCIAHLPVVERSPHRSLSVPCTLEPRSIPIGRGSQPASQSRLTATPIAGKQWPELGLNRSIHFYQD